MLSSILYNDDVVKNIKRRIVFSILLIALFVILMVLESALLCLLISDETIIWITVVLSVSLVLFSWAIIYLATVYLASSLARERLIKRFQKTEGKTFSGKIISASKTRTPMKFIQAYAVEMEIDDGIRNFYYDSALGETPFKEGEEVALLIKSNFICEVRHE